MLFVDGAFGLLVLALWIFCLVDVLLTPEDQCRNLPKIAWLLIVLFLLDIGSIAWLVAGRPRADRMAKSGFYAGAQPNGYPEYERLGRSTGSSPEADAQFLKECRERAEAQRRRYQEGQGGQQQGS
jgi:hypothetical protein